MKFNMEAGKDIKVIEYSPHDSTSSLGRMLRPQILNRRRVA
jgi:hypothetical protein